MKRSYVGEIDEKIVKNIDRQMGNVENKKIEKKNSNQKMVEGYDDVLKDKVNENNKKRLKWFKNGKRIVK